MQTIYPGINFYMPSYLHLTPEALTMRFRTKQQVKNSDLCGLVDDNLPDDLFILKGDELDIVEPEGTLNKDFALALGFNQITDANKAKQVAKLLVLNGPGLDPYTINYYTRRLKNGPYGTIVTTHIQTNFIAAAGGNNYVPFQNSLGNISDVDNDFVATLKEKLGALDCFLTPANYFNFQGIYGALAEKQGTWNYTTSPAWDTNNKQTLGQEGYQTAKKMPPIFQAVTGALNFASLGTYKKALKLFYTKEQLEKQKQEFEAANSQRKQTNGDQLTPDISTAKVIQEAATDVLTSIAQFLGDTVRIFEFKNINPYQYVNDPINPGNNAQRSQPPGMVGPQPSATNTPLNKSLASADIIVKDQNISNRLFDFTVVTNIPPSINTSAPYAPKLTTYENYSSGNTNPVSVFVSKDLGLNIGTQVYSEKLTLNGKIIPLVVSGYIQDSNDTTRVQILASNPNLALNVQRSALITTDDKGNNQVCVAPSPTSSFITQEGYIPGSVRIDTDGISKPPFYDPDYQPNTSYLNGVLDANIDNFVVVPIGSDIPLGTRVKLTNTITNKTINAFVGDRGPSQNGLGEMSLNAARELGVWPVPGAKNLNSAVQNQPIKWEFDLTSPKVIKKDIR